MQVQLLSRKVTSKTQVRSSTGSSKLTHSWASGGVQGEDFFGTGPRLLARQTVPMDLVEELRAALAPDRVLTQPLELALYARDASVIEGRAAVVCFPTTTAELQACVRTAAAHGRAVVPRGSGTGLAGGAVPVGDLEPIVGVTTK